MSRTVDEIKEKVNILDVVGQVVPLKRTGINHKGLCPFHSEKTPSFVVSEQRQTFMCFGCSASGDVIEFVKRYYNLDFMEAVEKLANEYGIPIEWGGGDNRERDEYYAINKEAATYFYRMLRGRKNPGQEYARRRGLTDDTLHTFGIGYADDNWTGLYDYMKAKGVSEEKLMTLGLISRSKGKYFDKFRNRLIFPIQNTAGKVIGFGGRILGEGTPKYLNSQETPVFQKKNNLYGLYQTKKDVVEKDQIILVEGYMDAVSLYQGGVRNVAASLGTALTEHQVRLIKRYTEKAVLSYDSDSAGVAAALRGMDIFREQGMDVRVLHVSDGKDPDDFIKKNGKDAFEKLVEQALSYGDYKIAYLEKQYDRSTDRGRIAFLEAVAAMLNKLGPVEADMYTKELADKYGVSRDAIRRQMESGRKEAPPQRREVHKEPPPEEAAPEEKALLKLLMSDASILEREEPAQVIRTDSAKAIYSAMNEVYSNGGKTDGAEVYDLLEDREKVLFEEIRDGLVMPGDREEILRGCLQKAKLAKLEQKQKQLTQQLAMAEETEVENREETVNRLVAELQNVLQEIQSVKNS